MKRLLTLTLCSTILLSCFLTGCNNTPDTPADGTDAVTTAEDTTVRETDPADTAETAETAIETQPETQPVTDMGPMPEEGLERALSSVAVVAGDSPTEAYAASELTKYLEMCGVSVEEDGYPIFTFGTTPTALPMPFLPMRICSPFGKECAFTPIIASRACFPRVTATRSRASSVICAPISWPSSCRIPT